MHHNHKKCVESALLNAEKICAQNNIRLTKSRKRVLEIVLQSHKAAKAYDVLEVLAEEDKSAKPPTVYRALEFLQQNSLVHKIESLNAYVACNSAQHKHEVGNYFLICNNCGEVEEFFDKSIHSLIEQNAKNTNFKLGQQTVEIKGICGECA
jgi:Fur family transcriptional regulator, zinc uptake regulator